MAGSKFDLARHVFMLFLSGYEKYQSRPGVWWAISPTEEDLPYLSEDEIGIGLKVLVQKELITLYTSDSYRLTELGNEACLHPEQLDSYLQPRHSPTGPQAVTINAGTMENTQIGHGNTQHIVTYSTVLQDLRRQIEDAPVAEEEKSSALSALNEFLSHPFVQTIVSAAAGVAAGK